MIAGQIAYKEGYKYQLDQDYQVIIAITPERAISSDFISLQTDGLLTIGKGYAWDGPSGPAFDTKDFMRGSLVHDALYQLIREAAPAPSLAPATLRHPCLSHGLDISYRKLADQILQTICKEDGMSSLRACWVYLGVRFGGGACVDYENPVRFAP
jgi:hypothetical protein